MKKYLIVSIILNIILSLLSFYGLLNYLVYSTTNSLSSTLDLIVLVGVVIVDLLVNYGIYKLLKVNIKKIFILMPCCVYLILISCLLMCIG